MKNSSKKSIQQIQNAKTTLLTKQQTKGLKGGSDDIGISDIVDG